MAGKDIVVLGRLADPYGLQGWLRLYPFGDDPLTWAEMPVWWVSSDSVTWREVKLKSLKSHANGLIVQFAGVDDRSAAEAHKGLMIGVPRELLPAPKPGEFYWDDLIGLNVLNTADETLGKLAGMIETGANDVMRVVAEDGTERLLPFVATVVLAVEKDAGLIRVEWGSDW